MDRHEGVLRVGKRAHVDRGARSAGDRDAEPNGQVLAQECPRCCDLDPLRVGRPDVQPREVDLVHPCPRRARRTRRRRSGPRARRAPGAPQHSERDEPTLLDRVEARASGRRGCRRRGGTRWRSSATGLMAGDRSCRRTRRPGASRGLEQRSCRRSKPVESLMYGSITAGRRPTQRTPCVVDAVVGAAPCGCRCGPPEARCSRARQPEHARRAVRLTACRAAFPGRPVETGQPVDN